MHNLVMPGRRALCPQGGAACPTGQCLGSDQAGGRQIQERQVGMAPQQPLQSLQHLSIESSSSATCSQALLSWQAPATAKG